MNSAAVPAPFIAQIAVLGRRLLDDTLAVPATLLTGLLFAVGFVVVNDGLLGGSAAVTAEVGGDYLAFIIPSGVLIATLTSGASGYLLAQDREDLYLDRLLTMPVSRAAIVLTPILLSAAYAAFQVIAVVAFGALLGAPPVTGVAGVIGMIVIASLWGMGVSGYMTAAALISGRLELTRIVDLFAFPLLFLSPLLLPQSSLQGWLQTVSKLNPTTYVIEGLRGLMIDGWQASTLAPAIAAGAGFAAVTLAVATAAARRATARR